MKTRLEMIYDFMLALAANPSTLEGTTEEAASFIYRQAEALVDEFVEKL